MKKIIAKKVNRPKQFILNVISEYIVNKVMELEESKRNDQYTSSKRKHTFFDDDNYLDFAYSTFNLDPRYSEVIITLTRREFLACTSDIKNLLVNELSFKCKNFDNTSKLDRFLEFLKFSPNCKAYISKVEREMCNLEFEYCDNLLIISFRCKFTNKKEFDDFGYENNVIFEVRADYE